MHKLLLIDFDGVLRFWPKEVDEDIELQAGLPQGEIQRVAFATDILEPAITGRCTDSEWRRAIVERLGKSVAVDVAEEAVRRWSLSIGLVDTECLQILREVSENLQIVLVTNATSRLYEDLSALGLRDTFFRVCSSYEMGVAKPERGFFERVLTATSATPESVLYVDDSSVNVAAARELGIRSHLFDNVEKLKRFLQDVEVLRLS